MKKINLLMTLMMVLPLFTLKAQKKEAKDQGYKFTAVKQLPATSVKNQYRSGTCWSFATISFLESELLRKGKGEMDLSEMFVVHHNYSDRAKDYVRYHGKKSFSGGAEAWDVLNIIKKYGMVPEQVYSGNVIGEQQPVHGEMDGVMKAYVDALIKNPNRKLTPVWSNGLDKILDAYLGEIPQSFTFKEKEYTPTSFADELDIDPADYITLTSFTHHPFYSSFIFEGADNWALGEVYNVPMEELVQTIDNAIEKGYSLAWGSDVSEKGFAFRKGIAIVPEADVKNMDNAEITKWEKLSSKEKDAALYKFDKPGKEKTITQEMRQLAFNNYQSTEDHLMHMVGVANDQNGNKYYIIKNSWGTTNNDYNGYFYASLPFVKYKTISIMLHRDALPVAVAHKLGM